MNKLGCSAMDCVNNISGLCSANVILVTGHDASSSSGTQCGTFAEKSFKNAVTSVGNTNYVGELKQMFSNNSEILMSPEVKCEARKCAYNKRGECSADNLVIFGPEARSSYGTACETFIEG
ncbi:DUF1540 domain-containing protein [Clostridium intestinale]|uniref:DUF1540 domain-containing protein n=1 Tax=Clostridium intestinale TaxID=36845 RepID=UPI0028EAD37C|nr:DUF1540 domain-containing protein [Clostridium intestinale]